MDFFAMGGRPLLSHFHHIRGIFAPGRLVSRSTSAGPCIAKSSASASPSPEDQADLQTSSAPLTGMTSEDPPDTASDPPAALHTYFRGEDVQIWDKAQYKTVKKLQDATRNRGQVILMTNVKTGSLVAVKQMPNSWIRSNHTDFVKANPAETEMPWQDVGCVSFLNKKSFEFACQLFGVWRNDEHTFVITTFASEGDLFKWCESGPPPGEQRELHVHPVAQQILRSVKRLHDFPIVHRDISLENILIELSNGVNSVKLIDFGMASTERHFKNCVRGKASYQAPELHEDGEYDGFLSDAFSVGVTLYALLVRDYPWLSTRPGGCKCFGYVKKHGFRAYLAKRKLRNSNRKVGDVMSEPLKELLEGLLSVDPESRLTLGETASEAGRRSVWDLPWTRTGGQT
uniref:Protein kinase domain-containing protein n=1 Tax=Noctiluca scintillans TaxID=2966 RepID=A0A7S1ATC9_NOCSC|mmetsp:Transcript_59430/g.158158  ORF Transcript_59430/g.158158 Transcript_59430/m.158158 type:complete len:400 (+) Transcript_59430:67-1266(+)